MCGMGGHSTLQGEELLLWTRVQGGVCVQICATIGGDYAVTHGIRYPTLRRGVQTGARDGVTSCWTEADREGATETVFEKHLEAGAEDAPLFQFQGP